MTTVQNSVNNGVNVASLLGAREALTATPEGAKFKWRASHQWINGTHSRSTVAITVRYKIDADATPDEIKALVAQSQKRSAVYDIVTNPTNVAVEVNQASA